MFLHLWLKRSRRSYTQHTTDCCQMPGLTKQRHPDIKLPDTEHFVVNNSVFFYNVLLLSKKTGQVKPKQKRKYQLKEQILNLQKLLRLLLNY